MPSSALSIAPFIALAPLIRSNQTLPSSYCLSLFYQNRTRQFSIASSVSAVASSYLMFRFIVSSRFEYLPFSSNFSSTGAGTGASTGATAASCARAEGD